MKVLISGGAGFVGSHFRKRMLDDGHEVTIVDPKAQLWSGPGYIVIDDIRRFITIYPADSFDLVIHCAAVVGGRAKIEGDPMAIAANLAIDSDVFRWLVKSCRKNPPHLIYFSSSAIYPVELQTRRLNCALGEGLVNLDTSRFGMPDQIYGFAKFAGEVLAKHAREEYGLPVTIYRPFSGYGEDQSLDYPFPSIVKRVVDGENPVLIWGSGEQQRDFIHIDDIVEAVLTTYKTLVGQTLNLGSGKGISFKALAQKVGVTLGRAGRIKIVTDATKPEGVFARVADTYEMEQHYKPKISLEQGIERQIAALGKRLTEPVD